MPSRYDYDFPLNPVPGDGAPGHLQDLASRAAERNGFLSRVFGLVFFGLVSSGLGVYLGVTTGITSQAWRHPWMGLIAYFGLFFAAQAGRRVQGLNLFLLFAFTAFTGVYLLAPAVLLAGPAATGNALATTSIVFIGLSAYAATTKRDFSFLGAFVFTAILGLLIGTALNAFFFHSPAAQGAFAVVGCFIFSAAILFDVWRLGRTMSTDDPILFAITLYLDFVNLFLFVLRLFSRNGSRSWS